MKLPLVLLDLDPGEAANKLIDRDVSPMYDTVCTALQNVMSHNFSTPPTNTLRRIRSTHPVEGRMWFGSEQFLLDYAIALYSRSALQGPNRLTNHSVTIPESFREVTKKPPNWLVYEPTRKAQIALLLRYDDFMRLDARMEYLISQPAPAETTTTRRNGTRRTRRSGTHSARALLGLLSRTRDAGRRDGSVGLPLIDYAIAHHLYIPSGDCYQVTLTMMREFVQRLDCYAQSPSAFFRRNNYTGITGMGYRDYYGMTCKPLYAVSDQRFRSLLMNRQNQLRATNGNAQLGTEQTPRPTVRATRVPFRATGTTTNTNTPYYTDVEGTQWFSSRPLGSEDF